MADSLQPPPEEPYQIPGTTPAWTVAALPGAPLTADKAGCFVPKIVY